MTEANIAIGSGDLSRIETCSIANVGMRNFEVLGFMGENVTVRDTDRMLLSPSSSSSE
jgi:hypothetical protein